MSRRANRLPGYSQASSEINSNALEPGYGRLRLMTGTVRVWVWTYERMGRADDGASSTAYSESLRKAKHLDLALNCWLGQGEPGTCRFGDLEHVFRYLATAMPYSTLNNRGRPVQVSQTEVPKIC